MCIHDTKIKCIECPVFECYDCEIKNVKMVIVVSYIVIIV